MLRTEELTIVRKNKMFNMTEYQKQYRIKNKEIKRKNYYRHKHDKDFYEPKTIYSFLINNAKKRNLSVDFSYEKFFDWYNVQNCRCYYCKRAISEIKKDTKEKRRQHRLSIDRKDNSVGYNLNNIVLACLRCNMIKGNYFSENEMQIIGMFIKRKIWKRK